MGNIEMADFKDEGILVVEATDNPLEDPYRPIPDSFDKTKWHLWVVFFIAVISFAASAYRVYSHQLLGFFGHRRRWKEIVYDRALNKKTI